MKALSEIRNELRYFGLSLWVDFITGNILFDNKELALTRQEIESGDYLDKFKERANKNYKGRK